MNFKMLVLVFFILTFGNLQEQELETYSFHTVIKYKFDNDDNDYVYVSKTKLEGKITIDHVKRIVFIKYPDKTIEYKLVEIQLESETYRTLHLLKY